MLNWINTVRDILEFLHYSRQQAVFTVGYILKRKADQVLTQGNRSTMRLGRDEKPFGCPLPCILIVRGVYEGVNSFVDSHLLSWHSIDTRLLLFAQGF